MDSAQYVTPVQWDWDPNNPYDGNPGATSGSMPDPYAGIGAGANAGATATNTSAYTAKNNGVAPNPARDAAGNIIPVPTNAPYRGQNPYDPNFYNEGLGNLSNDVDAQYDAYNRGLQPYTDAAAANYYGGAAARQGVIDQQGNAINAFSNNDASIYNTYGTSLGQYAQQGNDAIGYMGGQYAQAAGLDASNVSGLGTSLGNANYLDSQNVGQLSGSLGQANAMDAQNVGQLSALNGSMRQLTAGGYGADVTSDPNDVARQESAYGTLGNFANGDYAYTSQAAGAYADPEAIAAQKDAMGQLKEQSSPKLTDAERYLYMQSRLQQEQSNRANRDANLRELERSGMSGSTMALSNLNASSQENATTRAESDLGANAKAIDRASNALVNYGNLASTVSGQSFQQAYGRGQAADAASQFNTQTQLQGTVAQGNLATQMRSADDALSEFNKSQSLQQQRFQDSYAADQQQQAWGRGVDMSNAGFQQSSNISRNAAIQSNAGFQQSQDVSRNAGILSNAQFTQSGDMSRDATNLGNAQLTNIGQQRQGASDLARTGAQMNSDWLTGTQNLGNQELTATRDNTTSLGAASDAAFRQIGMQAQGDTQRNALVSKALDNQAEDVRAMKAQSAAAQIAGEDREAAKQPHSLFGAIFG